MKQTLGFFGLLSLLTFGALSTAGDPSHKITPEADTLMSLGSLRICLDAFKIDNGHFPKTAPGADHPALLKREFWPIYIRHFPAVDGWHSFWTYLSDGDRYLLISPGANGRLDAGYELDGGAKPAGDDILVSNGELSAEPHLLSELRLMTFPGGGKNPWALP